MNWAGGFSKIKAAVLFAAFGSVPITQVVSGGKIDRIQIEHVWVEAAIDYVPSRGMINKKADSWIPLDASYKQYEDLTGLDVLQISGIDPNQLATDFSNSGTINETEGWVQNLDATVLQTAQTEAQSKLTDYINTQLTNPTVGDVIGGRKIIPRNSKLLSASLPYRTVITGNRYGALPNGLKNYMRYAFGRDILGELINPVTLPLTQLNNHKITYSFKPATAADEATLASYLPEGEITDTSQLPSSLPAYLINVIPEIAVDGEVVAQGTVVGLGVEQTLVFQPLLLSQPNVPKTYKVPAGSYLSLAATRNSISTQKLTDLQNKLTETQTKLQSSDPNLIGTLTRDDILGDMFYAGILGYFGQYIALGHLQALGSKAAHGLSIGFGSMGYEPNVTTFFGFPRAITTGGVAVNMWVGGQFGSLKGNNEHKKEFTFQMGNLTSALEHTVLEQMANTDLQNSVNGVSAMKALQLASQQGQKIYQITPANAATVLPNLNISGLAMQEITRGLNAGQHVIAHSNPVSVPGWTGEGYIIYNPIDGSGAWKISGGSNGGFIVGWSLGILFTFSLAIFSIAILGILAGFLAPALLALVTMLATGYTLLELQDIDTVSCVNLGFIVGISMVLNTLTLGFGTGAALLIGLNVMFNTITNFKACFL